MLNAILMKSYLISPVRSLIRKLLQILWSTYSRRLMKHVISPKAVLLSKMNFYHLFPCAKNSSVIMSYIISRKTTKKLYI